MELLRGSTWRDALNRTGSFDPLTLAGRLDQVLDGLDVAHQFGLVHRDLKPENLMICPSGDDGTTAVKIPRSAASTHACRRHSPRIRQIGIARRP